MTETRKKPTGSWKIELPGGPVKADAIKNKTFINPNWMRDGDKDLVDCTFSRDALQSDTIAKNIRLINPTFVDLNPFDIGGSGSTFGFYINMGKKGEQRLGFVIYKGKVVGLRAKEFMETKDFDPTIIGLDFTASPGIDGGIRIRHGAYALIGNCKGLKTVSMRGHHHACVGCKDTEVQFLAGNLPGEFKKWWPLKQAGKGNYQRAEFCYADKVKSVIVGAKKQDDAPMKAYCCMVAPGQKHQLLDEDGFSERLLSRWDDLMKVHD